MATPIAALGHVGIRIEASYASGGVIDDWQPIDSEDLQLNTEFIYGDRMQASEETVGGTPSHRHVAGTINFGVSPQNPTEWWIAGLGNAVSPHSGARPLKSMLIQLDKETAALQASGCRINTMTFSSSETEELKCAVVIEGKDMAAVSAGTPTFTSGDAPFVHSDATFKLNGTTDANIKAFSVAINNNLATDLYGSDQTRIDIPATKLMVEGSFTKLFADTTEHNAFLARLARSFQVTYNRGGRSLDINIARLHYNSAPPPLAGQSEYIVETFNFTGYVDDPATENSVVLSGDILA